MRYHHVPTYYRPVRRQHHRQRLDFRVKATGRSGSDEGLDIRATEVVIGNDDDVDVDVESAPAAHILGERLWTFQLERERNLGQKRVREVVAERLASLGSRL